MPNKFNIVKRGYDPAEVDGYIEALENVIKSYKEKDAAIKNALVNAQLAADNIIKNAELEVVNSKQKAVAQLEKITYSITKQRTLMDNLQRDYLKLAESYIKGIEEREFRQVYDEIDKLERYLDSLKETPGSGNDANPQNPPYTPQV